MTAAAFWFARQRSPDFGAAEKAAFDQWLAADPQNAAAFAEVAAMWEETGTLGSDPAIRAAHAQILAQTRRRSLRAPKLWVSIAAGVAAAIIICAMILMPHGQTYRTAVGEQRQLALDDGSTMTLDTDTVVRVDFETRARTISLEHGQAYFMVAHDAARPFVVEANGGAVTAHGTAFSVRREGDAVTVVLVTGEVAVANDKADTPAHAAVPLKAGQQIVYTPAGIGRVRMVDAEIATNWTRGNVVFLGTPLSEAVAEINRYNRTKLVVGNTETGAVAVNGVFHVGDTKAFLAALASTTGVQAVGATRGGAIMLVK